MLALSHFKSDALVVPAQAGTHAEYEQLLSVGFPLRENDGLTSTL
jgi:hypothetical protein